MNIIFVLAIVIRSNATARILINSGIMLQLYSYAACPYTLNGPISPNPKSLIRKKRKWYILFKQQMLVYYCYISLFLFAKI